jgi:hypothetical protein
METAERVKAKAIFKELFTFKTEILNHNLRDNSSSVRLPKPNTNDMKKGFMYDGASIWKSIPQYMRESKSISSLPLPFEIT